MSFTYSRFWLLHELRRVRAAGRMGSVSEANAAKERRTLQRELVALRRARRGGAG